MTSSKKSQHQNRANAMAALTSRLYTNGVFDGNLNAFMAAALALPVAGKSRAEARVVD